MYHETARIATTVTTATTADCIMKTPGRFAAATTTAAAVAVAAAIAVAAAVVAVAS